MFDCTDYTKIFKTFEIVTTSKNVILKKDKKIYSTMKKDFKLLKIIQRYKKEIKSKFDIESWNYKKVSYYDKNTKNIIKCRENVNIIYVYDINKAYLSVIKEFNLISDELYNMIAEYYKTDKTKVMAILGSISTRKKIDYYENRKLIKTDIKQDKEGILIWNFIENKVSDIILDLKSSYSSDIFVYFWFDEIAFTEEVKIDKSVFKTNKALITKNNDIYLYEKKEIKRFDFLKR